MKIKTFFSDKTAEQRGKVSVKWENEQQNRKI